MNQAKNSYIRWFADLTNEDVEVLGEKMLPWEK
jgi:hypothetical protein